MPARTAGRHPQAVRAVLWAATLALCAAAHAAPVADVKSPGKPWRAAPARDDAGRVVVTVSPEEAPTGRCLLVVNKPAWMQFEDSAAPVLLRAEVGDRAVTEDPGLDLGCHAGDVPPIKLRLADDRNPVDPASLRFTAPGVAGQVEVVQAGPPGKQAELVVRLPALAPGVYEGELRAADMSPQRNELRVPWRVSVFGVQVAPDKSWVRLASSAGEFRLTAKARVPLSLTANGAECYATGDLQGWMYPREIAEATLIEDTADKKVCRVVTGLGESEGAALDKPGRFEFDLELRRELPCLIVRARCFNEVADGELYHFWGWLPGNGFETADGRHEWSMTYQSLGPVGWVYLPPTSAGQPGTGWISPQDFQESRFGSMLLLTVPTRQQVKLGDSSEVRFAIMPASSAAEVEAVAKQLGELGIWE